MSSSRSMAAAEGKSGHQVQRLLQRFARGLELPELPPKDASLVHEQRGPRRGLAGERDFQIDEPNGQRWAIGSA
jgi:hypothetical protein